MWSLIYFLLKFNFQIFKHISDKIFQIKSYGGQSCLISRGSTVLKDTLQVKLIRFDGIS